MNDPLGDMLTRIRNAQMRSKNKVSSPMSRLRAKRARRAQERRLYPRLCRGRKATAAREIEIELKYFDGEPVIREIERVSKPGRRVYTSVRRSAAGQ